MKNIWKFLGLLSLFFLSIPAMPLVVIAGIGGLWYFSKKKPIPRYRNLSLAAILIGASASIFLTTLLFPKDSPTVTPSPSSTSSLTTSLASSTSSETSSHSSSSSKETSEPKTSEIGILAFTGSRQLVLENLDDKRRATGAHIQLQDKDEPKTKRAPKLEYNPAGWKNYRFYYGDGSKQAWLMNRGHLVGYQFSGLNDEPKNLVAMTAWLNTGSYQGTNDHNEDSMLYYENRLDSWLATHPHFWLDYKVSPIYEGEELVPRQIELQYVGLDATGQLLEISLGGKEEKDPHGISHVVLNNVSPNASINYLDGTATNTLSPTSNQETSSTTKEKATSQTSSQAVTNLKGYFKDAKGRWHRANGKFASKAEIRAAGLDW